MSAIVSSEASSLLKPDPPLEIEPSKDKNIEQTSTSLDIETGDKSGDLLNYEHDEDEDDEDELEALRLAALKSRKPKKPVEPVYILKQHPSRNNLTQIVLSGPQTPDNQSYITKPPVSLPDTSRPPPGYTPLSIPPLPIHGSTYGAGHLSSVSSTLTVQPPHLPHIAPQNTSQIPHQELLNYYNFGTEKSRYVSSHHEYRDRSPDYRNRERHRSPYDRDRHYKHEHYNRSSSPSTHRRSPGKQREMISKRGTSRDFYRPSDNIEKTSKFHRYNSGSDRDESETSEEEVEEEVEVTATESEGENENNQSSEPVKNEKRMESAEVKSDDSGKTKPTDKNLTEADDVLNVDCTEEIDEFTNFLNEFEDELKEKPKKDKSSSSSNDKFKENKDPANTEIKRKKTKIIKRMVKKRKPSRKLKRENDSNKEFSRSGPESYINSENGSSIERRLSPKRSPYRGDGYSKKYPGYSYADDYKRRRQRTPTLSPEPKDKKLRFNHKNEETKELSRIPYKIQECDMSDMSEKMNDGKSKSLPPSRALINDRKSNSRGAISQSRDVDGSDKIADQKEKETPEERDERQFNEKLKRASTQEERERLLARRQKFRNDQPIELKKKVISLKSKPDDLTHEISIKEKSVSVKTRISIKSRLAAETGDSISYDVDDTLDTLEEGKDKCNTTKSKGSVIDLREQLSKKRLVVNKESKSDARSKITKPLGKSFCNVERTSPETDDNLDPLERATVEDVSPRTIRHVTDQFEDGITRGKNRLVLRDASRLNGRKVEAFTTEENDIISESLQEYSDEEILNNQKYSSSKRGSRISVMERLGKPVHNENRRGNVSEKNRIEPHNDDISDLNNDNMRNENVISDTHQSSDTDLGNAKKSKKDKREKKDKKEKKKLKELKKLEKKLKKLKAKKRHKSSEKYASEDSNTDSYDDTIEYFMSEDEEKEKTNKKSKPTKASKTSNIRNDENEVKKKYIKEEDSDDELFAFFEKDGGDSADRKNESKSKSNSQVSSKTLVSSTNDKKKKKDAIKLKVGSSNDTNLLSKMKKKNEKTLKRMKEIE